MARTISVSAKAKAAADMNKNLEGAKQRLAAGDKRNRAQARKTSKRGKLQPTINDNRRAKTIAGKAPLAVTECVMQRKKLDASRRAREALKRDMDSSAEEEEQEVSFSGTCS